MDATCTIQDSIHVFNLVHKYVSRILGTYHNDLREARAGFEPAVKVLQTSALPLGYHAIYHKGDPRSGEIPYD